MPDLDGVILTAPNSAHRPGTEAAAKAGKHAFVEKPVSNTMEGGRAMIEACKARLALQAQLSPSRGPSQATRANRYR